MNCRAYPDEKGIETQIDDRKRFPSAQVIAEPIPMKRELKLVFPDLLPLQASIAEPIPMKRELKQTLTRVRLWIYLDCRAYPDEKGIETLSSGLLYY